MIDEKMIKELGFEKESDSVYRMTDQTDSSVEFRIRFSSNNRIYILAGKQFYCDPDIAQSVVDTLNGKQIYYLYSYDGFHLYAQNSYCFDSSIVKAKDMISTLLAEAASAVESTVLTILEVQNAKI